MFDKKSLEMNVMVAECAEILLAGNIRINEETEEVELDLTEEQKSKLIEFAVNSILYLSLTGGENVQDEESSD